MTTASNVVGYSGQLGAGVADTITLTGSCQRVEIVNRDGTAEIFFSVAAGQTAPTAATVGGDCRMIPAAIGSYEYNFQDAGGAGCVVSLISSGTPKYAVQSDTDERVQAEATE